MAKNFAKAKCFIKMNGQYEEITYEELLHRRDKNEAYKLRKFIPLHGMLMEVSPDEYTEFYRDRRRQKYLKEQSVGNGDFSIDMITSTELNGEDVLPDPSEDIAEQVAHKLLLNKLHQVLSQLSQKEQILIHEIFDEELSERELAVRYGISQVAVHKRKIRILEKLRKMMKI